MSLYDGMEGSVVEVCVTTTDTIKPSILITVTATPESASGNVSSVASLHSVSSQPFFPLSADDYTIDFPGITFTNGSTIECVGVSVVDDVIVEGTEIVRLQLNTTNSQAVVTDTSILNILDNDGMLQLQLITMVSFCSFAWIINYWILSISTFTLD